MGFSDYFIQTVTTDSPTVISAGARTATTADMDSTDSPVSAQKSDQEILESIEDCYYNPDINADLYELKVGQIIHIQTFFLIYFLFCCVESTLCWH